jgi:cytochrome o ubiquinol oxidase subunit 2
LDERISGGFFSHLIFSWKNSIFFLLSGSVKTMKKKLKVLLGALLSLGLLAVLGFYLAGLDIAVLHPKGAIGMKQRDLLVTSTYLMLIVVIPVFVFALVFAWRYRAKNTKAKYTPDWEHSHLAECFWWGIPLVLVVILGVMTWRSSHELDPYKPLEANGKTPIEIQVVALDWKWLFIYPEQGIATVNFIQFPAKTPIRFVITADAPMNSFWIPELGGQIYAMAAMKTQLHLIADEPGVFKGVSANLSGEGFSGMRFLAKASSDEEFEQWVQEVKQASPSLGMDEYKQLALPSSYQPASYFVLSEEKLFDQIVMKFMAPK